MIAPTLASRICDGDVRALARAISIVENEDVTAVPLLSALRARASRTFIVGITGPPGAGKSTLVDRITATYRQRGHRVAILAIDPSSTSTGGAILGDRIRMSSHAGDAGVFIRSMATRGHVGGLAAAAGDAALVLGAAGFDVVLLETVGVGQDEVDVARVADATVVVLVPGLGDEVQALKAGLMEIADLFVVNKADHADVEHAVAAIAGATTLGSSTDGKPPCPILRTVATTGQGVSEVVDALEAFRRTAEPLIEQRRRARLEWSLRIRIRSAVERHLDEYVLSTGEWPGLVESVSAGTRDFEAVVSDVTRRTLSTRSQAVAVDHVGIATARGDTRLGGILDALGIESGPIETVAEQRVAVQFLETAGASLELLCATSDESPIARFLASRGPGLHHVALRVVHLESALATLAARGVRLVDAVPRPGAHGTRVAFVHPSSTGGVLLELVEKGPATDAVR